MIYSYKGHYSHEDEIIRKWNSDAMGVYYCGILTNTGGLWPLYIGKGTSEEGIRGRLLDHLLYDTWPDVTHFGFQLCDTTEETAKWELEEIARYKPKYNTQGK